VEPDKNPKATPNDIVVMTVARMASENSRRLRMTGFRRSTRGRMVPPAGTLTAPPVEGRAPCLVSQWFWRIFTHEHCASLAGAGPVAGRLE
jgi:hypothetical protein